MMSEEPSTLPRKECSSIGSVVDEDELNEANAPPLNDTLKSPTRDSRSSSTPPFEDGQQTTEKKTQRMRN